MWELRLLDKAAYQTTVEALDAFARGDASLLTPLVARCHAQLRSEEFTRRNRPFPGTDDLFARHLDAAVAQRDLKELADNMIPLLAMPDWGLTLVHSPDDSPNLVEFGDHDAWLYAEMGQVDRGFANWWTDRCQLDFERHACGLSMFLLSRESRERLQETARKVVEGPSSRPGLGEVRDRLLDLIARSLADDRMTIAVCDVG